MVIVRRRLDELGAAPVRRLENGQDQGVEYPQSG
jgi:hypothetical protein